MLIELTEILYTNVQLKRVRAKECVENEEVKTIWRHLRSVYRDYGRVKILWTPSHTGIKENDEADEGARKAMRAAVAQGMEGQRAQS